MFVVSEFASVCMSAVALPVANLAQAQLEKGKAKVATLQKESEMVEKQELAWAKKLGHESLVHHGLTDKATEHKDDAHAPAKVGYEGARGRDCVARHAGRLH